MKAVRDPHLRAALDSMQRRIRELTEEKEATQREVAELRQAVAEQTEYLDELAARVQLVLSRDDDLRAMLLSAHDQLMNRADEIHSALAAELHQAAAQHNDPEQNMPEHALTTIRAVSPGFMQSQHTDDQQLSKYILYQRLIRQIRDVVRRALPPETIVVVVSKGDEELLKLGDGRQGWHFPQNEEGVYAGYYPTDSAEAIAQLEGLRDKGAQFVLFPGTAFWWLEKYEGFGRHLEERYRRVWEDETCIIYELAEQQTGGAGSR
jgi:hypothetical protein